MPKQDLLVVIAGDNTDLLKKLRATKRDISSLGKDLKSIGSGLTTALTLPLIAAGAAVVGFSADFDSAMAEVQAKTGASADEFARLRDLAKELGATTRFSATEAANAMTFLAQAGFSASEIMASLEDILALAAAGNLDLARAADIASNVLSGFGLAADQAGRAADVMAAAAASSNTSVEQLGQALSFVAPVAKDIGVSLEEATAIIGKLSDAGIQATRAGTGLRAAMLRLLNPTKEVRATFERLGVSIRDSQGNLRPFLDIMKDLNRVGADATDMAKIFGQETVSAASVIRDAAAGDIQTFTESLEDSTGAARAMAAIMDDNLKGAFRAFKSALEGLAIAVGDSGLSADLRSIVEALTGFVRGLTTADPVLLRIGTVLAGVAAVLGPVLLAFGALAGSITSIMSVSGPLLTAATAIGAALTGWAGAVALVVAGLISLGVVIADDIMRKQEFDQAMRDLAPLEQFKDELDELGRSAEKGANETWPEYVKRLRELVETEKLLDFQRLKDQLRDIGVIVVRGSESFEVYRKRVESMADELRLPEVTRAKEKLRELKVFVVRGSESWSEYADRVLDAAKDLEEVSDASEDVGLSTDEIGKAFERVKAAGQSAGNTLTASMKTLEQALKEGKITQEQFNQAQAAFRQATKKSATATKELKKSIEELVAAGELGVFTGEDLARVWSRAGQKAEEARKAWAEVVKQVGISVPTLGDFKKAADAAVQAAGAMRDKISTVAAVFPPLNLEMDANARKTFELEAKYKAFGLTSQMVADTQLEKLRQKLEFARAEFDAGRLSLEQLNEVQEEYNEALGITNEEFDVLKDLGNEITGIIANLGSAITDSILGAASLGEAFVSAAKQIAAAILDTIIQEALKLLTESILENDEAAQALIKSFKKFIGLFTGSGGVSLPGGGKGGGGGGGGGGAGGAAGGLAGFTNVLSALDSLVSIVTNLINVFTFRRMEKDLARIEVTTRGLLNEALNFRADQWQQHTEVLAKWDMAIQTLFDMKDLFQRFVDGSPTAAPAPGGSGNSDLLLAAVNRVGDIVNAYRIEFANFTNVLARPQLDHVVEQTSLLAAILIQTSRIADAVDVITAIPSTGSSATGTFNLTINAATNDPRAIAQAVRAEAERMGFTRTGGAPAFGV